MQRWALLLLVFTSLNALAQRGILIVKKHGFKKVASFAEGSPLLFETGNGSVTEGYISLIRHDTVYVNGLPYHKNSFHSIIIRKKTRLMKEQLLYATAGTMLSTAGMTLAKWAPFKTAAISSATMGFGNLMLHGFFKLGRKQYLIGKKFSLQVLDLHF